MRREPFHRTNRASSRNTGGASASARTAGSRPSAARPATACSRVVTPASWSELASVLRRWANAPSTTFRSPAKSGGSARAPERDERRVDVGRRPKDGARDGMESRSRGGELDQDGDGSVRLRRRNGEEAVCNLALHHHAPVLDARKPVEALGDDGRGDVVREVRDELRRRRVEARRDRAGAHRPSGASRSARRRCRGDAARGDGRARRRERARTASARTRVSAPRPGPISRTTSAGSSSASRAMTPRMLSSTRKCCPRDFLGCGPLTVPGARRRRSALRSIACSSTSTSSPRASASTASVCSTLAGSFRLPRSGCGARYGLSVSARMRSAGTAAAASRSSAAFGYVTFPANET